MGTTPRKKMTMVTDNDGYGADKGKSQGRKKLVKGLNKAKEVSEKIKNLYNRATKRKTISMEMDGKTFTGTEKVGKRRSVTKVSNPILGSRKSVETYDNKGNTKRQRIVDRDAYGGKMQVIKKKY